MRNTLQKSWSERRGKKKRRKPRNKNSHYLGEEFDRTGPVVDDHLQDPGGPAHDGLQEGDRVKIFVGHQQKLLLGGAVNLAEEAKVGDIELRRQQAGSETSEDSACMCRHVK